MLRIEDTGELVYGGIVTATQWWDDKRIAAGTLAAGSFWKKYSTYAYLGIGIVALAMSAFGWMRRYSTWAEHISHGFIYALPGFARQVISSMGGTAGSAGAGAVAQAQAILAARRAQAAAQLGAGRQTARTYEPQFNKTAVI